MAYMACTSAGPLSGRITLAWDFGVESLYGSRKEEDTIPDEANMTAAKQGPSSLL